MMGLLTDKKAQDKAWEIVKATLNTINETNRFVKENNEILKALSQKEVK